MRVVLVGVALLAFAGGASKDLNVAQSERDVVSGRVIYSTICIRCHGTDGKEQADEVYSSGRRPHVSGGSKAGCEAV